jgi:subtilisin family serine protease
MSLHAHTALFRARSTPALLAIAAGSLLTLAAPSLAIVSSGTNGFNGVWLNQYLGATRYYNAGYTGTRATMVNIEGGHVWNGHETLTHVNTYISGAGVPNAPAPPFAPGTPNFHSHSTWVGHAMGGRTQFNPGTVGDAIQSGIGHGATLWSGSIATAFTGSNSFSTTFNATLGVYAGALNTGVNGVSADVSNSSYGSWLAGPPPTNNGTLRVIALDALAYATGKTMVFSAGNRGAANTVGDPGLTKNGITVGALTGETGPNPFSTVASYSSRGPSDFALATAPLNFSRVANAVASVDIVAPGDPLTLAYYGGASGGNTGGTNDLSTTFYNTGVSGTSFASPIVAGGAALLVDAARANGHTRGNDARVVKAVLMNSATKLPGWTNNTTLNGSNVLVTTQGVDFAQGAGRVNFSRAFEQQLLGTTDVPGLGGGVVADLGWDYGVVAQNTPNDYTFATPLIAGNTFTATLAWFAAEQFNLGTLASASVAWGAHDVLGLELYRSDLSGNVLVASSNALYNNNQHINITIPQSGNYFLRVNWAGGLYDFINKANSETYGLAWSIPAPGTAALLAVGILAAGRRRR